MRFRDYDGMAWLALAGALASAGSLVLPWITVRQGLQPLGFSGIDLLVAPAIARTIGTPGAFLPSFVVAAGAAAAVLGALGGLVLALEPGLRAHAAFHRRGGRAFAVAGLVGGLVAVLAMWFGVGPAIGPTAPDVGAFLGLLGFGLAIGGWPRARMLGEADEPAAAPSPGRADDGP